MGDRDKNTCKTISQEQRDPSQAVWNEEKESNERQRKTKGPKVKFAEKQLRRNGSSASSR